MTKHRWWKHKKLKYKRLVVGALVNTSLALSGHAAHSQDFVSDKIHAVSQGAAIVQHKAQSIYQTACNAVQILGLCSNPDEGLTNSHSLSLGRWHGIGINADKAAAVFRDGVLEVIMPAPKGVTRAARKLETRGEPAPRARARAA